MNMLKLAGGAVAGIVILIAKVGAGSGDVEQLIAKPPATARAMLSSSMVDMPMQTLTSEDGGTTSVRTEHERRDDRIVEKIIIDDKPAFTSTFSFNAENAGASTRVRVAYDIDRAHINKTRYARDNSKTAISDSEFESTLRTRLAKLEKYAEAGFASAAYKSDAKFDFKTGRFGSERSSSSDYASRANTGSYARRRAQPMASAAPMVDPNAVARAHVRGDSYE